MKQMKNDAQKISPVLPNGTILVGFDFTHGRENDILIVGRKTGKAFEILNAFQGERARSLFNTLTIKEEK